ncbi:aldehyde dehydrogenase family protein [Streptomyces sp. NPDC051917]|uniref:aldehyde dehydrogenase family protein n=1 Tax=Streptomyces sp. NPDC051917 TaxID=3154754 RepID=UPI00345465E6
MPRRTQGAQRPPRRLQIEGRVIREAVAEAGLHEGVFSLIRGAGNEIGETLVDHPLVRAVTFTGSEGGGMALYRRAQQRPDPIPVFTEMTSVNPVFVLPGALAARGAEIGAGLAQRAQYNVGQACLKPAVLLAVDGPGFDELRDAARAEVAKTDARTMLTPGIHAAYTGNVRRMQDNGATRIGAGRRMGWPVPGVRGDRRAAAGRTGHARRGVRSLHPAGTADRTGPTP